MPHRLQILLDCGPITTHPPKFGLCDHVGLRLTFGDGCKMIIDLDSWETGYADGQLSRPSRCPADLDQFSYSSGYCQGHTGGRETLARRRAQSQGKRVSQRGVGGSQLIIL